MIILAAGTIRTFSAHGGGKPRRVPGHGRTRRAWYPVLVQLIEKVSAIRRAKDEVAFLNKKLNLVGSVTRHDVLNQLTAVSGYTELLGMVVEDPQMKSYIEKSGLPWIKSVGSSAIRN